MTLGSSIKLVSALAVSAGIGSSASAAIMAMTNPVLTAAVDGQSGLVSFDVGSTTYDSISIATVSPSGLGNSTWWAGGGNSGPFTGAPSDANDALDDAFVTTGIFGTGTYKFDTDTINAGDAKVFYVVENAGNDDGIVVNALDASNNVIAGYSLTLNAADYGNIAEVNWNGTATNDAFATTFTIADFGDGNLASISGIEIVGDNRIDVGQVGVATEVPEPASLILTGMGGLLMIGRSRRSA